ncbi:hypothetical protein CLV48_101961 [Cecembia rubra]|uniref:Nucleoid-structuring protein H-NS n=2 Tax=Cecembia rubra TaxID=1485585 RepID=A0A2P8EEW6_9BACT|nr:hypothetical protein CLV48_101961 [Cecembia rubra]
MLFVQYGLSQRKNKQFIKPKMKRRTIQSPVSTLLTLALFGLLAMGACKSKKKVAPAPAPAPVEQPAPTPPPAAPQPSAEEIAVGKLENYFNSIAQSTNVDAANRTINEALGMFSNSQTPVLIVIHQENGIKDYDEPTTIEKYLHYLKDTKKNLNFISDIRLDGNGRVTELELRRKK